MGRWGGSSVKIDLARAQKLADAGLNGPAIAAQLGVTRQAIYLAHDRGDLQIRAPKRLMRVPESRGRIDRDTLLALLRRGLTTRAIAKHFGVQPPAVICSCHRHGFPLPGTRRALVQSVSPVAVPPEPSLPAVPPEPSPAPDPRRAELVATGGRYADLAAWAAKWGVGHAQARIEWGKLGLPLQVRGASDAP